MRFGVRGHVDSDNRKITVLQFENVRTIAQGRGLSSAFVRVRAESSSNHTQTATLVACIVKLILRYGAPMAPENLREHINATVARLLREEREKRGMSKNMLSQKSGLSRQTITFIEEEQRKPTLDSLLRMTEALGFDIEDIIRRARKLAKQALRTKG